MDQETNKNPRSAFFDAVKISDLRTAQQIEEMNGRPWERVLPPPPVLPPYGKLIKIRGRLESFGKECFREYFSPLAYRTSTLKEASPEQRGVAAAAAIAVGSPGLAGLMTTRKERSAYRSADYIQGVINGHPFRGWVGMTRLQAGDEVEMVAEWQENHYQVYAIALPAERIISVCPDCDMGRIAQVWLRVRNMLILATYLIMLMTLAGILMSIFNPETPLEDYIYMGPMELIIIFSVTGGMALVAYKAYSPTVTRLAEEIFTVMGMENVKKINLHKTTRRREKQLQKQGLWYSYLETDKPRCPSGKFMCSFENWFYY